jgi:ribosomal protein S7
MRSKFNNRLDIAVFNDCDSKMHKFINLMSKKGNKQLAYSHFLKILFRLKVEFKQPPKFKFLLLLKQMSFPLKVSDVLIAKIKFKTPHYVKTSRAVTIQYLNIIKCSDSRDENSFFARVSNEFIDYCKGVSNSYKLFIALKNQIKTNKAHGRFKI